MTTHFLIESLSALEAVSAGGHGGDVMFHSSSPGVVETLRAQHKPVAWIEDCAPDRLAECIGKVTARAVEALQKELAAAASEFAIPCFEIIIARQLYMSIGTLLYKQALLSAWRNKYPDGIVVGDLDISFRQNGDIQYGQFDTMFAALAIHPDNDIAVIEHRVRQPKLADVLDTPSLLSRFVSWSDISVNHLFWRIWRYGLRGRRIRVRPADIRVLMTGENEAIREILPYLLFQRASIEFLALPQAAVEPVKPLESVPTAQRIEQLLDPLGILETPVGPVAAILHRMISSASRWWRPYCRRAAEWADTLSLDKTPTVLLSNTVAGFAGGAMSAELQRRGVRVILVEHGVSAGLSDFHLAFRRWNEAQLSDVYLVCSDNTRNFVEQEQAFSHICVRSIGLADIVRRVRFRTAYRALARKILGIGGRRAVLYLARPEQNNMRWFPYASHDRDLYALQKTIAFSILPRVRGLGIYKTYLTQRFLDPMPIGGAVTPLNPAVRLIDRGDFRFVRSAVDVIILESLMSTLGFAFGTGVPLVFLRQAEVDPLPDVEQALKQAVFVVDTRDDGWDERLVALLNQPDKDFKKAWEKMAPAREAFLQEYVFGPDAAGRNGAAEVLAAAAPEAETV